MPTSEKSSPQSLLGFLTASFFCAFVTAEGAFAGLTSWYLVIQRPNWAAKPAVFEPVWLIVYGLAGLGAWLAYRSEPSRRTAFIVVFCLLFELSALWAWLFFAWHLLVGAVVVAVVLWAALFAWAGWMFRLRATAGALTVPLVCWFCYASALSLATYRLNPPSPAGSNAPTVIDVTQ